jgi:hypothetical protein
MRWFVTGAEGMLGTDLVEALRSRRGSAGHPRRPGRARHHRCGRSAPRRSPGTTSSPTARPTPRSTRPRRRRAGPSRSTPSAPPTSPAPPRRPGHVHGADLDGLRFRRTGHRAVCRGRTGRAAPGLWPDQVRRASRRWRGNARSRGSSARRGSTVPTGTRLPQGDEAARPGAGLGSAWSPTRWASRRGPVDLAEAILQLVDGPGALWPLARHRLVASARGSTSPGRPSRSSASTRSGCSRRHSAPSLPRCPAARRAPGILRPLPRAVGRVPGLRTTWHWRAARSRRPPPQRVLRSSPSACRAP